MYGADEVDAVEVLLGLNSAAVTHLGVVKDIPNKKQTRRNKRTGDKQASKQARTSVEKPKKRAKKEKPLEKLSKDSSSVQPRVIQVCNPSKLQVDHSYKDYSLVAPHVGYKLPAKVEDMTFVEKLHHILSEPEYSNFIAWESHGRAFRILIPHQLEEQKVLDRYFGHNSFSTFLSQLRGHGFKQLLNRKNNGCYYHECMLRGLPHLCKYMQCYKEGPNLAPDPENEPDFDAISSIWPLPLTWKSSTMTNPSSLPPLAPKNELSPPTSTVQGGSPSTDIFLSPTIVSPTYSAASNKNINPSPQSQISGFLHEQMNAPKQTSQPPSVENQLALLLSHPNLLHQAQQQMMMMYPPSSASPIDQASLFLQALGLAVAEQNHAPVNNHDPNIVLLNALLKQHVPAPATHHMQQHAPTVQLAPQLAANNLIANLLGLPHGR